MSFRNNGCLLIVCTVNTSFTAFFVKSRCEIEKGASVVDVGGQNVWVFLTI